MYMYWADLENAQLLDKVWSDERGENPHHRRRPAEHAEHRRARSCQREEAPLSTKLKNRGRQRPPAGRDGSYVPWWMRKVVMRAPGASATLKETST